MAKLARVPAGMIVAWIRENVRPGHPDENITEAEVHERARERPFEICGFVCLPIERE